MLKMLHPYRWNRLLIAFLLGLIQFSNSNAQEAEFNHRDVSIIHLRAMEVLHAYENTINQLGEAIVHNPSITNGIRDQFLELCVNPQITLFNDLDPNHSLSEYLEAETYINTLELSYPDGIEINMHLDEARVGNIQMHGNESYTLDFIVDKQLHGNYRDRQFNTNLENLLVRIGFIRSGKEFRNFSIVGIRKVGTKVIPNDVQNIQELNSQTMKRAENEAIKQGVASLVNDYSNLLWLIGNKNETDFDKDQYARSFKALFELPDLPLYNDIVPDPLKQYVSLDEYLGILRLHYPEGITNLSITVDSIMYNNVIVDAGKTFIVNINIDKFFSGVYDNQEVFRNMSPQTFKVSFQQEGRIFKDFRIRSIEPEAAEFIEEEADFVMPIAEIMQVSRKGLALEILGSYGQTRIEDHRLLDMNLDENLFEWNYTPDHGYTLGIGIIWHFNDHFSVETGGFYNQYNTNYSLNGEFINNTLLQDINGDSYYQKMIVEYDSSIRYNLISVPLTFTYTSSKPGKTGIYLSLGGLFSYCLDGSYHTAGSWQEWGRYPYHPLVIEHLNLEALGFETRSDIDERGDLETGQLNFSARASIGLAIPIKYFTQIRVGPEVEWGLYDFNIDGGEAYDIFRSGIEHAPTYLYRFGLKLSVLFNL